MVKRFKCRCVQKYYIWTPATCSCKNSNFLAGITDDSMITCDEIVKETKSVVTNFNNKYSM